MTFPLQVVVIFGDYSAVFYCGAFLIDSLLYPASPSEGLVVRRASMWHDVVKLLQHRDYLLLLVSMSLLNGMFSAVLTCLFQIISEYGYR